MIASLLVVATAWASPDRTQPPEVLPAVPLDLPAAVVDELRPGVRIQWVHVPDVRHVVVDVKLGRGCVALLGGSSPTCDALDAIWGGSAKGMSADELELRAGMADAGISAWVGLTQSGISLTVPTTDLDEGLVLLDALLSTPTFPGSDLRREVRDTLQWWSMVAPNSPRAVASYARNHAWWSADHPVGVRPNAAELARVKPSALRALHRRLLQESPVDVVVVGDVDAAALRPRIAALLDGIGADVPPNAPLPSRPSAAPRVIAVDVPGAEQSVLTWRTTAPPRDHADEPSFDAIQYALGGHFLARLNANLREDKGYTYGVSSSYTSTDYAGTWTMSVELAAPDVGAALDEVTAELAKMSQDGITASEHAAFATSLVTDWNVSLQTASMASGVYTWLRDERMTLADLRDDLTEREQLDIHGTAEVAKRWLMAQDRAIVVVGPREPMEDALNARFDHVTWITPQQAIAGSWDATP